ncbi:MAG TPA: hypothetical protein VFB43_07915 [Terracidiphilus sp.]|jgi:hypothetical protein|nr:hypothetical protein [Terracidiphilus sp.]
MKGIVLILCGLVGYMLAHFFPDGGLAIYAPMLISYHLFLAFLVVTAVQDKGLSLSPVATVLTHVACLTLLVVFAEAREHIPYFWVVRFFTPSIALFEATWLFSGKGKRAQVAFEAGPATAGSAEDYDEFIQYLRQSDRQFSKPGRSVKEEFKYWLDYRAKHRSAL